VEDTSVRSVTTAVIGVDTPLSDFLIAASSPAAPSALDHKPLLGVKSEPCPLTTPDVKNGELTDSQRSTSSIITAKDFATVLRHRLKQLEVPADKLVSVEAKSLLLALVKEHLAPAPSLSAPAPGVLAPAPGVLAPGVGLETLVSQFLAANPCDNQNELLMLVKESDRRLEGLAAALIHEVLGQFKTVNATAVFDSRKVFTFRKKSALGIVQVSKSK